MTLQIRQWANAPYNRTVGFRVYRLEFPKWYQWSLTIDFCWGSLPFTFASLSHETVNGKRLMLSIMTKIFWLWIDVGFSNFSYKYNQKRKVSRS